MTSVVPSRQSPTHSASTSPSPSAPSPHCPRAAPSRAVPRRPRSAARARWRPARPRGGRRAGSCKAAEVAGDPTIRQLLSAFFADRFPSYYDPNAPTMIVPPEGGDFSEGANIVRNPGFVEGSEGLAFASSFDPSAPFWTAPPAGGSFAEGANLVTPPATGGMTASQLAASVAPYLGAAAGGAMSGGE